MIRTVAASLFVLVFAAALPAAGQTATGTIAATANFLFMADAGGQYEVTATWDNISTALSIFLICDGDELTALAAGQRDRTARLSVGVSGNRPCVISLRNLGGPATDYTLNFQGTTATLVTKLAASELPAITQRRIDETVGNLRLLYQGAASPSTPAGEEGGTEKGAAVGPTRTFLEQIQGGVSKSFFVEVEEQGLIQITAMWNRQDTNLRISMICRDGGTTVPWGFSESRQERVLRFDADVVGGTTCEVTLESPNTMVFALNIALLANAGLVLPLS